MTGLPGVRAEPLDWRTRGLWLPGRPVPASEFVAAGHHLFDAPMSWPVMIARRSAIEANIATVAGYFARHGVRHAPHCKTTMAPSLIAAQLAAGAWGITTATPNQALLCRELAVPRVLLANELLDPRALRWAAAEIERGWRFSCYVDSTAGVAALAAALRDVPGERPFEVLVELGYAGGRSGCRSVAEVVEVAMAASAANRIRVAGVAGYEGALPDVAAARAYLGTLRHAALAVAPMLRDDVVVSAGGSTYFDVVVDELTGDWLPDRRVEVVVRPGAYVAHDDGYCAARTPFLRQPEAGALSAALRIWAQVLSVPEPGLAIVGMGKRDAPYDEGMPVPQQVRGLDGALRAAGGITVTALNDQHGYLALAGETELAPGELVCFGISHPCTAFDKWRTIPVVDDDLRVVDLIHTYF
ncbi:MAG TPA: alanine racemase [Pilimelia sp.]|nr:alanine racemase [Pilimelia sp.]